MNLLTRWRNLRRMVKDLDRIAAALERQAHTLQILVDHVIPAPVMVSSEQIRTATASFAKDDEQARIQDYVEQCWKDLQRAPTDEEIVQFLDGEEQRP